METVCQPPNVAVKIANVLMNVNCSLCGFMVDDFTDIVKFRSTL